MSLPILGDLWDAFNGIFKIQPGPVKFLMVLSVFLYAGSTILKALIFLWNLVIINSVNLGNGCLTDASLCIPQMDGIFIWGINVADYWTITFIVVFATIATFALKWYAVTLRH